ncbi:MAG: aldehyde dehydrogenase family protein, partial [Saccharopolyspora sp.]|uniref:aldehyde dehydrogenase family protein n=1 Tax=Saccharopolyspora sp. TaxID=33915 RepID=UPI0025F0CEB4
MTTTNTDSRPLRDFAPQVRTLTIANKPVQPDGESWEVRNPATEDVLATVGGAAPEQVDQAVAAAREAFGPWSSLTGVQRSAAMHRLADVFEAHRDELLASIVNEVGTPVSLAEGMQVALGISHLRWQAEAAKKDRTVHLGGF